MAMCAASVVRVLPGIPRACITRTIKRGSSALAGGCFEQSMLRRVATWFPPRYSKQGLTERNSQRSACIGDQQNGGESVAPKRRQPLALTAQLETRLNRLPEAVAATSCGASQPDSTISKHIQRQQLSQRHSSKLPIAALQQPCRLHQ